jgi:hypothetical protein
VPVSFRKPSLWCSGSYGSRQLRPRAVLRRKIKSALGRVGIRSTGPAAREQAVVLRIRMQCNGTKEDEG